MCTWEGEEAEREGGGTRRQGERVAWRHAQYREMCNSMIVHAGGHLLRYGRRMRKSPLMLEGDVPFSPYHVGPNSMTSGR